MRVRTVSALDARRNASVMPALVLRFWYSSVVSHTEPVQTPCAPRASDAATWRPRADATGAEHGDVGPDGVHDLRRQHHAGDLAGVAAGLVALGDDDVDAVLDVRQRVLRGSGQRRDLHAGLVGLVDDVLRAASRARSRSGPAGASRSARCRRANGPRSAASPARRRGPRPQAAAVRRAAAGSARRTRCAPRGSSPAGRRPCPRSAPSSASRRRRRTACRPCCRRASRACGPARRRR